MAAPIIIKPIPPQVVNEQATYGPFNLKDHIQSPDGETVRFRAELSNGQTLPKGMICTEDGIVTGIPAKNTQGNYEVIVTAENDAGSVQAAFVLTIKPSLTAGGEYVDQLKSQIWEAMEKKLPIPDLGEMLERPISPIDIYYLLEQWGTLVIWDSFNLDPPGEKQRLTLEGVSKHYNIYDRVSSLIAAPKDLFSHERTLVDGLQTARAMAREVYKRGWTIEFAGLDKMTRAAWVEIQHLGDKYGKKLEIINYTPSLYDMKVYTAQALELGMRSGME